MLTHQEMTAGSPSQMATSFGNGVASKYISDQVTLLNLLYTFSLHYCLGLMWANSGMDLSLAAIGMCLQSHEDCMVAGQQQRF